MFGFKYFKADPATYVLHYKNGKVAKSGQGLSFFYFAPVANIVAIPFGSSDIPFILKDISSDFQEVTFQGNSTYKVNDPKKLTQFLNFGIKQVGSKNIYLSDDPEKLSLRISNIVQVLAKTEIQKRTLKECLKDADKISEAIFNELKNSQALSLIGIEIINFSILAIKPTPETSKALEAEMRESLLRNADYAIYERRNAAIENERKIKENELTTELSLALRKREINEKEMETQILIEEQRRSLIEVQSENIRQESDAKAYAAAAAIKPFADLDPKTLEILSTGNMEPKLLIANAFKGLADNSSKIGTLNITPDLLKMLVE